MYKEFNRTLLKTELLSHEKIMFLKLKQIKL
jgi:hypothetical protein